MKNQKKDCFKIRPIAFEASAFSIVVPLYNEESNIKAFCQEIDFCLKNVQLRWSLIFVDDGSTDQTLNILRSLACENKKISYFSLSRNFGHQAALRAGLQKAHGDCVVTMDGDLQHPPLLILSLLREWYAGADIVTTIRDDQENISFFKATTSRLYYKIFSYLAGITIHRGASDFRLIDRKVLVALNSLPEQDLFMRGMISWMGFQQASIRYKPNKRFSGKSQYSLLKMIQLAADGIFSFSIIPLRIASALGLLLSAASFAYILYAVALLLFTHSSISGWTSLLVSTLLLGGVQLASVGMLGEYIGRILLEGKKRPPFFIKEMFVNE